MVLAYSITAHLPNFLYFVQYNFHPANINRPTEHEREQNETVQNTYIDIINTCIKYNIDVQPHISLMSMYLTEYNPEWQIGQGRNGL